jgi:hypothetical protein
MRGERRGQMNEPEVTEVIYEVECSLDPSIVEKFDAWLPGHARQVLACEGFTGAEIQAPSEAVPGQPVVRRTQYRLRDRAALERYLEQDAPRLRADAASFGDQVTFSRRVLSPSPVTDRLPETPFTCLDCGAEVAGRYCAQCGQSREVHVLSMHEVVGDVTHSLLDLDSRVWNTLRTLALRPGELTREFIAGRHQRYLPPFRLYLVISVMFFALSTLLPDAPLVQIDRDGADEVIAPIVVAPGGNALPAGELNGAAARQPTCNVNLGWPKVDSLLQEACRKLQADGGRRLGEIFLHTAPRLMFVFLPLIAGICMLFYWRPRRLYTEHLVALLHSHAFVFLALSVTLAANAIMRLDLPLVGVLDLVNLAVMLYLPWYVFRAMQVIYGQGRVLTAIKFIAISLIYFVLLGVTMAAGLVYSMLSL